MSFQAFLNEIEKGLPSQVYLFSASDPFIQREALEAVKRLMPETDREFNLHTFDLSLPGDDNISVEQILNIANTFSFFGGRRITVLAGNLQKLSKKDIERLNAYISNPAQNSVFIMLHHGLIKKDTKEKFGALKYIPLDIRETEIPYWIKQRAGMKGVEISDEVPDYLISITGTDLGLLSSEIEKISLIGKKKIDVGDISDIVTGGKVYTVFDLVNALKEKKADEVFRIYKKLKETADDYSLIGALNWQYGRGLHANMTKSENNYLLKVFELLSNVDRDIKSSGRNFPLEYLLVRLLRLQAKRSPSW